MFLKLDKQRLNLEHITHIEGDSPERVVVHVTGGDWVLLKGDDAAKLLAWADKQSQPQGK